MNKVYIGFYDFGPYDGGASVEWVVDSEDKARQKFIDKYGKELNDKLEYEFGRWEKFWVDIRTVE